mmetsp:Transcript_17835/g.47086  ORF Transcript_17835/g.47086 Transcript_17835/m.47086 type:complete len:146 (-) Transcript_17835:7-444(-)
MSSIQEAIYNDSRKHKPPKGNFVALTNKQEAQGSVTNDDFHLRMQERREEEKMKRTLEGGKAGGYNERQGQDEGKPRNLEREIADGVDDFGRRVAAVGMSKAERAQAALERLRQKGAKKAEGSGGGAARRGRSRSRSRSRGRGRD